jgi:hypothetical protein
MLEVAGPIIGVAGGVVDHHETDEWLEELTTLSIQRVVARTFDHLVV